MAVGEAPSVGGSVVRAVLSVRAEAELDEGRTCSQSSSAVARAAVGAASPALDAEIGKGGRGETPSAATSCTSLAPS
jgi:hypothetical protein